MMIHGVHEWEAILCFQQLLHPVPMGMVVVVVRTAIHRVSIAFGKEQPDREAETKVSWVEYVAELAVVGRRAAKNGVLQSWW